MLLRISLPRQILQRRNRSQSQLTFLYFLRKAFHCYSYSSPLAIFLPEALLFILVFPKFLRSLWSLFPQRRIPESLYNFDRFSPVHLPSTGSSQVRALFPLWWFWVLLILPVWKMHWMQEITHLEIHLRCRPCFQSEIWKHILQNLFPGFQNLRISALFWLLLLPLPLQFFTFDVYCTVIKGKKRVRTGNSLIFS